MNFCPNILNCCGSYLCYEWFELCATSLHHYAISVLHSVPICCVHYGECTIAWHDQGMRSSHQSNTLWSPALEMLPRMQNDSAPCHLTGSIIAQSLLILWLQAGTVWYFPLWILFDFAHFLLRKFVRISILFGRFTPLELGGDVVVCPGTCSVYTDMHMVEHHFILDAPLVSPQESPTTFPPRPICTCGIQYAWTSPLLTTAFSLCGPW